MLQERLARNQRLVEYILLGRGGPEHDPTFTVATKIDGKEVARGKGRTKKSAEQDAALATLHVLEAGH
jgi:ribonuclease-3